MDATSRRSKFGISSIFDPVFQYFPIFLLILQYWITPKVPLKFIVVILGGREALKEKRVIVKKSSETDCW